MPMIDKETPADCQIAALKLAAAGLPISEDIRQGVLNLAERGKSTLEALMLQANRTLVEPNSSEYTVRENVLRLAAQIAFSRGMDSREACELRLNRLHDTLYIAEPCGDGIGFTE